MNLVDVTIFVEAVQAGSLSAAGRRLGITAMAASRRLAALEDELGARLVHRTTRSLALTAEGEAFLPHARALLESGANALAAVRPVGAGVSGTLRITASGPFGRKIVAPMIPAFLADHPEMRIDLMLSDEIVDIVARGIDLAIRIGVLRDSTLIGRRIADNPRGLYASPEYLTRRGTPTLAAELADHECLTLSGTTHWDLEREGRVHRQRVGGRFTASGVEALHEACMRGAGIARLSGWNVSGDLESGRLVELSLRDAALPAQWISAVYPTATLVPRKVHVFIAALEAILRPAERRGVSERTSRLTEKRASRTLKGQ